MFCSTNYLDDYPEERDAMRHSMWNALSVSQFVPAEDIDSVTMGYEYDNFIADGRACDSTMDLYNNRVGQTVFHTTTNGLVDQAAIVSDLEGKYVSGGLWIWTLKRNESVLITESEGILIKSDGSKIY